jgi:hypothetical protein
MRCCCGRPGRGEVGFGTGKMEISFFFF